MHSHYMQPRELMNSHVRRALDLRRRFTPPGVPILSLYTRQLAGVFSKATAPDTFSAFR